MTEDDRACLLKDCPKMLLGRVWPQERVIMGLRVSKWIAADLASSAAVVLLVAAQDANVQEKRVQATLMKFSLSRILLDCDSLPSALSGEVLRGVVAAASTGPTGAIKSLNLTRTRPPDLVVLLDALKACTGLERVDLQQNLWNQQQLAAIFDVLKQKSTLARLGLGGSGIDEDSVNKLEELLGGMVSLTHLDLGRNEVGCEGMQAVANALSQRSTLHYLDISWNAMGASGATALARVLRANKGIRCLNVYAIEMGPEGADAVAEAVVDCAELQMLSVDVNSISGPECASRFAAALQGCRKMRELSVAGNPFGSEGIQRLALSCAGMRWLTALNLRQTQLGAAGCGAEYLGAVLRECARLRHLDVTWNEKLGDAGALALAEGLQHARALSHLDAAWCGIGVEGARRLVGALLATPSVVSADLQMNRVPRSEAKRLARACTEERAAGALWPLQLAILAQNKVS